MNGLFLSVIVPVYNAEKFLKECVDSILEQSFETFELILVDDGSDDSSGEICDEYAEQDERVKVLHSVNYGIFQARKAGIRIAEGKYVTFLDADDWIEQEAFDFAMENLLKDDEIDFLTYAYRYNQDGRIDENFYEEGIYDRNAIRNYVMNGMMFDYKTGKWRLAPSLCTKFIRKSLCYEIVSNVTDYITLGEDALITYPSVCRANKIGIFNRPYYHYRVNGESCTHVFPLERITQVIDFQKNIVQQIDKTGCLPLLAEQIPGYTRMFIAMMVKEWFGMELSAIPYVFPANEIPQGAKVAIYGAGTVGKAYIREFVLNHYVEVTAWIDRNYESMNVYMGRDVVSVNELKNADYDFLIIAIFDEDAAMKIKGDLVGKYGVDEKKIYWKKPIPVG